MEPREAYLKKEIESLKARADQSSDSKRELANALDACAHFFFEGERFDEASEAFEEELDLLESVVNSVEDRENIAMASSFCGLAYMEQDEYERATKHFGRALGLYSSMCGDDKKYTLCVVASYANLGQALSETGDYEKAEYCFRRETTYAIRARNARTPNGERYVAEADFHLAFLYLRMGRFDKVVDKFDVFPESPFTNYPEEMSDLIEETKTLFNIADLRLKADRFFQRENIRLDEMEITPEAAQMSFDSALVFLENAEYDKAGKVAFCAHYLYTELLKRDFDKYVSKAEKSAGFLKALLETPGVADALQYVLEEVE